MFVFSFSEAKLTFVTDNGANGLQLNMSSSGITPCRDNKTQTSANTEPVANKSGSVTPRNDAELTNLRTGGRYDDEGEPPGDVILHERVGNILKIRQDVEEDTKAKVPVSKQLSDFKNRRKRVSFDRKFTNLKLYICTALCMKGPSIGKVSKLP